MEQAKFVALAVGVALLLGLILGYWSGNRLGYERAKADIQAARDAVAQNAVDEAAKAANPFTSANPLENVNVNPFESAKKALNPFE